MKECNAENCDKFAAVIFDGMDRFHSHKILESQYEESVVKIFNELSQNIGVKEYRSVGLAMTSEDAKQSCFIQQDEQKCVTDVKGVLQKRQKTVDDQVVGEVVKKA